MEGYYISMSPWKSAGLDFDQITEGLKYRSHKLAFLKPGPGKLTQMFIQKYCILGLKNGHFLLQNSVF
jgi:hypothetical protein